jgi:hypothetical protein
LVCTSSDLSSVQIQRLRGNFRWELARLVNIFLVEINWIPSEEDKVRLADGPFIRKIDLLKAKQNGK